MLLTTYPLPLMRVRSNECVRHDGTVRAGSGSPTAAFHVFEEYEGKAGVEEHFEGELFKKLGAALEAGKGSIKYITFDEEL